MEEQYTLQKPASHKKRKRVGCGISHGQGKTCGRGMNGQRSRSGSTKRPWFEGGQMPLQRRVPKRGFKNAFHKVFQVVNLSDIDRTGLTELNAAEMEKKGLIRDRFKLVKILGKGEISRAVKVQADAFSKSATDSITKAGGETIYRNLKEEIKQQRQVTEA